MLSPLQVLSDDQVLKYGRRLVVAYVDRPTPMRIDLILDSQTLLRLKCFSNSQTTSTSKPIPKPRIKLT